VDSKKEPEFLEVFGGCSDSQKEFFEALLDQQLKTAHVTKDNFLDSVKTGNPSGDIEDFETDYCIDEGEAIKESPYGMVRRVTHLPTKKMLAVKIIYKDLATSDQLWQISNELTA
jgi:hypothetical protein